MKSLIEYIIEAIENSNRSKISKEIKLRNAYALSNVNGFTNDTMRAYKHTEEYLRAYFGDNEDEILHNVSTMLSAMGIDVDRDVELEYGDHFNGMSGRYGGVKITANVDIDYSEEYDLKINKGDYLYVVNLLLKDTKLTQKMLTPKKLNLVNEKFDSREKFIEKIIEGLKGSHAESYTDALICMCNGIKSESGSNKLSLDDIINKGNIEYKFTDDALTNLTDTDLKQIDNDFGEVLGPIMLMEELANKVEIAYPTDANSKTFDYYLYLDDSISVKISAKSGSGSSVSPIDRMKDLELAYKKFNSGELEEKFNILFSNITEEDKDFLENIVPIIADNNRGTVGSGSRRMFWRMALLMESTDYKNRDENIDIPTAINILREHGMNISKDGVTVKDLIECLDEIYNSDSSHEKFKTFLKNYYDVMGYNPSGKNSINNLVSAYGRHNKQTKEGIIVYPIRSVVSKYLNANYKESVNKLIQAIADGYQLDMRSKKLKDDTITMRFKLYPLETAEYKFEPGGSVDNPVLCAIGLKASKKRK